METATQQPEPRMDARPEPDEEQPPRLSADSGKTPQEFYAEITRREDVRAILEALATADIRSPDANAPQPEVRTDD
jgi:hypothetical protein